MAAYLSRLPCHHHWMVYPRLPFEGSSSASAASPCFTSSPSSSGRQTLHQAPDEDVSRAVPSLFSLSRDLRHSRAGASLLLPTCRSWPTVHRTEFRSCQRAKVMEHIRPFSYPHIEK